MRWVTWLLGAVALAIATLAWERALTFDQATTPQRVQWFDSAGQLIDTSGIGHSVGDSSTHSAIVLGDRLIVETVERTGDQGGFAWIHPASGDAKIAWPLDPSLRVTVDGIAVRDVDTFALVLNTSAADHAEALTVGIAGRDGWLRTPTELVRWKSDSGRPLVLGSSWIDGELEVVVTHPDGEDVFGARTPVDIFRIPVRGDVQSRKQRFDCTCLVQSAVPGAKGWRLVVDDLSPGARYVFIDAAGVRSRAPDVATYGSDRTALGTLWGRTGYGDNRVERDGTITQPITPIAGWHPLIIAERIEWIDGVLRSSHLYSPAANEMNLLARRAGDRVIVTSSVEEDLVLVGPTPDALRPVIAGSWVSTFRFGVFLPRAGGGYYWVQGQGDYVTLDDDLRRIDQRTLREHLRTRGSLGNFIDEPKHVWYLGWALLGLPLLLAAGLVGLQRGRPNAVTVMLGLYVLTGGGALLEVLSLL